MTGRVKPSQGWDRDVITGTRPKPARRKENNYNSQHEKDSKYFGAFTVPNHEPSILGKGKTRGHGGESIIREYFARWRTQAGASELSPLFSRRFAFVFRLGRRLNMHATRLLPLLGVTAITVTSGVHRTM